MSQDPPYARSRSGRAALPGPGTAYGDYPPEYGWDPSASSEFVNNSAVNALHTLNMYPRKRSEPSIGGRVASPR
eukprot:767510-Hanusia_phi.AAC.2